MKQSSSWRRSLTLKIWLEAVWSKKFTNMSRIERTPLEIYPVIKNKEIKKGKKKLRERKTLTYGVKKQKTEIEVYNLTQLEV